MRHRPNARGSSPRDLSRVPIIAVIAAFVLSLFLRSGPANSDSSVSVQGFHIVTDVATCSQFFQTDQAGQLISQGQLTANCQTKFSQGLTLFSFMCTGCDTSHTWVGRFVVNGAPGSEGDIVVSTHLDAAWSVRPDQFKAGDCVALALTDIDSSTHQTYQSNSICTLTASGPSAPSASPTLAASAGGISGAATPLPQTAVTLAPPSDLQFTEDPVVCAQHAGHHLQVCAAGLFVRSSVFLIWDRGCSACSDGFDVFLLDQSGAEQRIATVDDSMTVVSLRKSSSDGHCFTVRAHKGSSYSQAPQAICYKE